MNFNLSLHLRLPRLSVYRRISDWQRALLLFEATEFNLIVTWIKRPVYGFKVYEVMIWCRCLTCFACFLTVFPWKMYEVKSNLSSHPNSACRMQFFHKLHLCLRHTTRPSAHAESGLTLVAGIIDTTWVLLDQPLMLGSDQNQMLSNLQLWVYTRQSKNYTKPSESILANQ